MSTPARAVLAAVAFLTRIPVGRLSALDTTDVARGAVLFPLVGAVIGGVAGLFADLVVPGLPGLVAGGLAVGLTAVVTGAMHLDALADTADGLGGTTRELSLEIMRDHAVGAFGAVALTVVCLVDAAAFAALAADDDAWLAGAVAGGLGRAAMLPLARALPYARLEAGQGSVLDGMGWTTVLAGRSRSAPSWPPPGASRGSRALAAAAAVAVLLGLFFRTWLGGVTGDTLGATAKLCETAALVAILAAR